MTYRICSRSSARLIAALALTGLALPAAAPSVAAMRAAAAAPTPAADSASSPSGAALDGPAAGRFAALALKCLHQEYPNHISHTLNGPADARAPHELTPAFYGCLDWHSDVHGHWLLVRLLRLFPDAPFTTQARAELARSFTPQNMAGEIGYLHGEGRASFERPYGLAWLLRLAQELRSWGDADGRGWSTTLAPLESEAAARLESWLPKLHYPIRIGEHDQTAFSFGLMWDWATATGDEHMRSLLADAAARFYRDDRNCPLAYEPSGEDFLSPCLAEADFMRRVLPAPQFARWLSLFLPKIPRTGAGAPTSREDIAGRLARGSAGTPSGNSEGDCSLSPKGPPCVRPGTEWLLPGVVTDRADPKLAHIDGLNLSRAWMLQGIAHGLPEKDSRRAALLEAAAEHADASLPAVTGEHYEGGHWLATYAVYLTTEGGLHP